MVRFSSTVAKIPAITPWASSGNSNRQRTNGRNYRRILCRCIMAPRQASATSWFGGFRLPDTGKVGWYPENKAWVFDLDTQKWSALPPMPTTRGALAAVAVGQKIYVSGGAGIPQSIQLPDGVVGGGPVDPFRTPHAFDTSPHA